MRLYDKAIKSASDGKADYSTDIKPWFGGQVGVAVSSLPSPTASSAVAPACRVPPLGHRCGQGHRLDRQGGRWQGHGRDVRRRGLTIFGTGDSSIAVGVDDTVLIGGDVATVHGIVDAKGAGGLASTADFKTALANSPKDRVGFFYVQMKKLLDAEMAAMPSGANAFPAALLDQIPAWVGGGALFDSNALVFDEVAPFPAGATVPTNRTSTIAAHLPASTVATFEGHDVGKAIKDAIKVYQGIPAYKEALTSVLDALDKAGGLDSYTSWLGDTAVAVTVDGDTVGGGLVVTLQDKAASDAAGAKFAALKNLVALAGLPGAKVTSEAHGGATITTIDLGLRQGPLEARPGFRNGFRARLGPAGLGDGCAHRVELHRDRRPRRHRRRRRRVREGRPRHQERFVAGRPGRLQGRASGWPVRRTRARATWTSRRS